jgi:hypothetical protein
MTLKSRLIKKPVPLQFVYSGPERTHGKTKILKKIQIHTHAYVILEFVSRQTQAIVR